MHTALAKFDEGAPPAARLDAEPACAAAWLVPYKPDRWVALPLHTTIEVLDAPPFVDVPGAAYYCNRLLRWRGQWLPLLDLDVLVTAYRRQFVPPTRYVLIVAYQSVPGEPLRHGAISLPATPATVRVSDNSQCALPTDSDLWPVIALSCFQHAGRAVPILDTGRLFSKYHG